MTGRRLARAAEISGGAVVLVLGLACVVDLFAEVYARGLLRLAPGPESLALAAPLAAGALLRAPRPALAGLVALGALGGLAPAAGARLAGAAAGSAGLLAWVLASSKTRPVALGPGLALAFLLGAWRQVWGEPPVLDAALALLALAATGVRARPRAARPLGPRTAGARGVQAMAAAAGIAGVLALGAIVFSGPLVLACHTGTPNWLVPALSATAVLLWTLPGRPPPPAVLAGANLAFAAALVATFALHGVGFPSDPAAYPILEPEPGLVARGALVVALALSPVLAIDLAALGAAWRAARASPRLAAAGANLCGGLLVVLCAPHVLVAIWDYVPLAGPWFRNRYALAHLIAAAPLLLAIPWARGRARPLRPARGPALVLAVALLATFAARAERLAPAPSRHGLRLVTWNVQQARTRTGAPGLHSQTATLRALDADVIALQESDTCRLANGNLDYVGELARALRMHAHHGPRTVTGTFGVAILSRHPILEARVHYLPGRGERTAVLDATVQAPRGRLRVLVTHLGNGGPLVQQRAVLGLLPEAPTRLALLGDFNFRPGSPQYRETVSRLADGWARARARVTEPGPDAARRIDHVFVSPDLSVRSARLLPTDASDHPVLVVDLDP